MKSVEIEQAPKKVLRALCSGNIATIANPTTLIVPEKTQHTAGVMLDKNGRCVGYVRLSDLDKFRLKEMQKPT